MSASSSSKNAVPGGAATATLVFGGARSGKSRFAEDLAVKSGLNRLYVATSPIIDAEMHERVAQHRAQRGEHWRTLEEELDLAGVLDCEAGPETVILIDCLTLWLNNLIYRERDVATETARLAEALRHLKGPCVLVSNEVGMGIVPDNPLARSFRDLQGRLNQDIAAVVRQVIFVAAGLPLILKPSSHADIKI
ncbi:bifunctional adenosylcobinamide kinase/adenosylcobinamide-phosphate guanylyltransferase [Roseibium polysiphoniae]|uniref:Bifunctional adenosylcobalamin biosynthesis protein n=1 Tax=Roseibium polysiphoniae TaxID=2571221 RepID=A0ABR9C849_9HYPH|nr:bifunctional adenosylcobinamide kinase/adenosylcobinamide-phosphate guanylyltransferase [Roseibium polysiphoniae]MBD8875704.1 bifunctional adenosylcobinamide kinase/adenosylcobinamide-phosphate guanylyltransferase [Roseibium polysiphoniae]